MTTIVFANFVYINFVYANFVYANFVYANFVIVNFVNVNFIHANFVSANFVLANWNFFLRDFIDSHKLPTNGFWCQFVTFYYCWTTAWLAILQSDDHKFYLVLLTSKEGYKSNQPITQPCLFPLEHCVF